MLRALLLIALCLAAFAALAAPPPAGSEEAKAFKPYAQWFNEQSGPWGLCCSIADGREVDVKTKGEHFWVRFLHPETVVGEVKPVAGQWYEVPPEAVLHGTNPTGRAIAWWLGNYQLAINGKPAGYIRCFINADLY